MRSRSAPNKSKIARRRTFALFAFQLGFLAVIFMPGNLRSQTSQKAKLPRPSRLDEGISLQRDPATGELKTVVAKTPGKSSKKEADPAPHSIRVETPLVPITCSVTDAGGALAGLTRASFRIYDNGVEQPITYFDASTQPATIALVIDASPSTLPESTEIKDAARALVDGLSPTDQVAVIDFSAHTYLQLPFSNDWGLIRKAISRIDVRDLFGDPGGSNIYQSVFLTARELFAGRTGRKAIVLLTDGQDSGLGLTLDPKTAGPRAGWPPDQLTFDDVARALAAEDIVVFAVSTESRPKIMTPTWVQVHSNQTLLTYAAQGWGIPAYTLYLAELTRRSGGQLYFLREAETLADTFRQIALKIRAEYTLGFSPANNALAAPHPGWHQLRVEVNGHGDPTVVHRSSYYVVATP